MSGIETHSEPNQTKKTLMQPESQSCFRVYESIPIITHTFSLPLPSVKNKRECDRERERIITLITNLSMLE